MPTNDDHDLSKIPGYRYATAGKVKIDSSGIGAVYHGSSTLSPSKVRESVGLPARGTDIDLIRHVEPPPSHDLAESAFRGTVDYPFYPAVLPVANAAQWAGEDGWVYEILSWRGYVVNRDLEGRIPDGMGGFRGPLMFAENEIAISARVPERFVSRFGRVVAGRGGLVVDWGLE